MRTYAFIDASNLFYGGEKSLGWKIDYTKLLSYLEEKYDASKAYYFGGVELHNFSYDYQHQDTVPIGALEGYLSDLLKKQADTLTEAQVVLVGRHLQRARFYSKLAEFGYELFLKPVKSYEQEDGATRRKANCDVEMTFRLMKDQDDFDRAIILSGDGDFLPVLKHLKSNGKEIIVLSRGPRTAKEIRRFAGSNFRDFEYLRERLRMDK
ncbi:MAG: NYN domain-containing protein [bacterium]|nr:NYN domain-containing protein [bacterium]